MHHTVITGVHYIIVNLIPFKWSRGGWRLGVNSGGDDGNDVNVTIGGD
jgi:hypothetical protein